MIFNLESSSSEHMIQHESFGFPIRYVLKDGWHVPEDDKQKFEAFIGNPDNCRVNATLLYDQAGTEISISTVFLGIPRGYLGNALPVLWETQIRWPGNKDLDDWIKRYACQSSAHTGHEAAVDLVKAALMK